MNRHTASLTAKALTLAMVLSGVLVVPAALAETSAGRQGASSTRLENPDSNATKVHQLSRSLRDAHARAALGDIPDAAQAAKAWRSWREKLSRSALPSYRAWISQHGARASRPVRSAASHDPRGSTRHVSRVLRKRAWAPFARAQR